MKVEKPNLISSKYGIVFTLIFIACFILVTFINNKNIKIIEDEVDPKQKVTTRSCMNYEKVLNEFSLNLNLVTDNNPDKEDDLNIMIIKVDGVKPLLKFNALKNSEFELSDRQLNEALIIFEKNIDSNIKKLGLINYFKYPEFNKMNYIFKQSESYYTISIPTKVDTSIVSKILEIRCGVIDSDILNNYTRVERNYTEKQEIELLEINNNIYKFKIRNLDSDSNFFDFYDFSKNIPELINQTQEIK